VVIDEQHKFGVKQRSFFKKFGSPHILQMTATPIPRTLALAYFAEFDVSIIDQMPAGRKPIITKVVTKKERTKLKYRIIDRMKLGQSVFVVVPLVYENEQMEWVHSAEMVYDEMKAEFSDYLLSSEIGLMHGKLSSKEKDDVMQKFKNNTSKILVSTTVIEVGVDVPQATIMIIKNSERFGLSQLHQLRGRVGRSDIQSYCFLETKNISWNERLKAMEDHTDGFKLAEIDMKLRWTGEVMGYRQSGESDIPTEILMDITFIEKVQQAASWLFEHYPGLKGLKILESEMDYVDGEIMV
jgi:ATP-dependent DNA helicase RecG